MPSACFHALLSPNYPTKPLLISSQSPQLPTYMLRVACRRLSSLVSNRDLFLANAKVNAHTKVTYDGPTPSLYSRSVLECPLPYLESNNPKTYQTVTELLRLDPLYKKHLESRGQKFQDFVAPVTSFLFDELLLVLCGLSNMHLRVPSAGSDENFATKFVSVPHELFRLLGKRYFRLNCMLSSTFEGMRHLTASAAELEHSLEMFNEDELLARDFMRANGLLRAVIPYRGAQRLGPFLTPVAWAIRKKVSSETAVGSFFTILGLLLQKLEPAPMQEFWDTAIFHSRSGILSLARRRFNKK